jgi:hypothetical protein
MHPMDLLLAMMAVEHFELVVEDLMAANFAPSLPCAQLGLVLRLQL